MAKQIRPSLFINTEPLDSESQDAQIEFEEIAQYSITPRTFQSRNLRGAWYIDEYSCSDNRVVRYGINSRKIQIDVDKQTINGERVVFYNSESQEKSSQSTVAIQKLAATIIHHSLEQYLVAEAIKYLVEADAKTVLVDIFARESGGIKILKNGFPETHTILLYKNPPIEETGKHVISVIDPSNFAFSSHLSNLNHLLPELPRFQSIVTMHKSLQIYKSLGSIGPLHEQYRDCIDVAVKLAFGFNKLEGAINLEAIITHEVVKAISNLPKIDTNIMERELPVRIKQTSEIDSLRKFIKIEEILNKNFQLLAKIFEQGYTNLRGLHSQILSSESNNEDIINNLVKCNGQIIENISTVLNEEQGELLELVGALVDR